MPALPSFIIDPLWDQFAALLPERTLVHPLGCHRPRIADRIVFDKLLQVLVLGRQLRQGRRQHLLGNHDPDPAR